MKAPTVDLSFDIGSTDFVQFQLLDEGSSVDITGYAIKCEVRKAFDTAVIKEFSIANGKIIIVSAIGGSFQLDMSDADSADFQPIIYKYDIFTTNLSGEDEMVVRGDIKFCNRSTIVV